MIDIGKGWESVREGIDRAKRMEEHRLAWIEEPFWPDDYDKYARLAAAVDIPIAGGEEETTLADFERLVERGGVEIVQPDVTRAGGLSECLRIADYAHRRGRRCVLHAWSTGIIKAATLHVLAAMEEAEYMEYCVQTTDLNQRLVAERFPLVDGQVAIPERPGLGIELDEAVVQECAVQ
jgi:L-alanine-DL-glutamate epimerase-like enolase superfamily enzyme